MKQYTVTGMSCAACVSRVEKAVQKVPGVTACAVSLLTGSMSVEGDVSGQDIIAAVERAGYQAEEKHRGTSGNGAQEKTAGISGAEREHGTSGENGKAEKKHADGETKKHLKRLISSAAVLLLLMYVSMGHMMFGFPMPRLFTQNAAALGCLEMILAAVVMIINQRFFISGTKSVLHFSPNMDTLVALGSMVSFVYSVTQLFSMMNAQASGGVAAAEPYLGNLYFESAAMILVFISVGKTLEAHSKGKTTDALKSLIDLAPKTATVIRDSEELTVPVEQIRVGDTFVVKPGESIPVDGVVTEGQSAVNEASLTGESIPVDKAEGDEVSAATINQSGYLRCRATRVGEDTTLSKIIEMVSNAAATKAPIAKTADRVAGIFVPAVLGIALLTFLAWMIAGESVGTALTFATAVLVISCPCSLGLATPVAIMVGNGVGAKHGVLFKTAAALELAGRIQTVALDKTGTITKGEPKVTDICPAAGITERELLLLACSLEVKSEHPLGKAIVERGTEVGITAYDTRESEVIPGKGIRAKYRGTWIYGGNEAMIREVSELPEGAGKTAERLSEEGKTPMFFAEREKFLGIIAVSDVIRDDAREAVTELQNMGIRVVMITGDNERTANAIAALTGVDRVVSGVLPGGKEVVIRELKNSGTVAMVGDGINDAPALTSADLGIAVGSGTDVAISAADVVLMNSQLRTVPAAIRLGRKTLRNIRENLFWAFFYNSVGIPIAAGVLAGSLGLRLNPAIGALAMSLSSFCVVTNALRLNLVNIYDARRDRKRNRKRPASNRREEADSRKTQGDRAGVEKQEEAVNSKWNSQAGGNVPHQENQEETKMTKTIQITGMMCPHCEARVKAALLALPGVKEAVVSHESGTAVVTLQEEVSDETLRGTVEKEHYTVTGIC